MRYRRQGLFLRRARPDDAEALAAFECSTGAWYEDEVQDYVRGPALDRARMQPDRYRLLLAFEGRRLVAVGAHVAEALILPDDAIIAIRLQVLAIALADQGRVLRSGDRLSDVLLATLVDDAIRTRPAELVTAIVAAENLRSIALCERNGLGSHTRFGNGYVRLTGRIRLRD